MIISTAIEEILDTSLTLANKKQRAEHVSSGKLSASMLGMPLQWQILKALKVEGKEIDAYTLRKFKRGNDVEDMLVKLLTEEGVVLGKQMECNYRDVVGYMDLFIQGSVFESEFIKKLPVEVKSVTNANFKWISKRNEIKTQHALQAGLYALAMDEPFYSVLYFASDDYRIKHIIGKTKDVKDDIDGAIDEFQHFWGNKEIPLFEPKQKWMALPKYNSFPEWMEYDENELQKLASKLYK